jgi:hypothetical protein
MDSLHLRNNNEAVWFAALLNWVEFLHIVISFLPSVKAAIIAAATRFYDLVKPQVHGVASEATQELLLQGAFHFSKQVIKALYQGQSQGGAGVLAELALVPKLGSSTLAAFFRRCDAKHDSYIGSDAFLKPLELRTLSEPAGKSDRVDRAPAIKASKGTGTPQGSIPAAGPSTNNSESQSAQQSIQRDHMRKLCLQYLSEPGCRHGRLCKYIHELPTTNEYDYVRRLLKNRTMEASVPLIKLGEELVGTKTA